MASKSVKFASLLAGVCGLYFGLLGIFNGIILLLASTCFLFGFLAVSFYYGKLHAESRHDRLTSLSSFTSPGIPQVLRKMEAGKPTAKLDHRLTGASVIDEQLQEILDLIFRYYIKSWYTKLSDDNLFLLELRRVINTAISNIATRAKQVDWTPFFTQTLVDELASHVKLYRRADQKVRDEESKRPSSSGNVQVQTSTDADKENIEKAFFEYEKEMEENMCRRSVCSDVEAEKRFLREIVEVILYFVLPEAEFDNRMCRVLMREVLVNQVILPSIDKVADPDYVNQYVVYMCDDSTLTSEAFLSAIRMSTSIPELHSVLHKVNEDIARVRSKDTGGVDDADIKQTLSSLLYLQRICEARIGRLNKSHSLDDIDGLNKSLSAPMPFTFVMNNDVAIQYFNEYLLAIEKKVFLDLNMDIECCNKVINQMRSCGEDPQTFSLEIIRSIYERFFNEEPSSLQIDHPCIDKLAKSIAAGCVSMDALNELHDYVMEKLEKSYESFKSDQLYSKMMQELEVDSMSLSSTVDEYSESQQAGGDEGKVKKLTATIVKTGIATESKDKRETYGVYSINVTTDAAFAPISKWETTRRYSDFYDLYILICDKYPALTTLQFPAKTTFNNTRHDVLEKRAKLLNEYLHNVLTSKAFAQHPSLQELMSAFLNPGTWERPKDPGFKKMGVLMRKVSNTVFKAPDKLLSDVADGVGKELGKIKSKLSLAPNLSKTQLDSCKVKATLDTEDEDNIPLRIILLLLDEVFDLRKKNQWLRRRIVAILRQIIKAALGDRINRRIVDHVEYMISSEQMAEYVKQFKERYWPCGVPAEINPPRDRETELRTCIVCKAKMIGSLPDELRHMIGSETTKLGVLRVFNMFQHKKLNRRLIYAVIEALVKALFPCNNAFQKLFRQIHSEPLQDTSSNTLL